MQSQLPLLLLQMEIGFHLFFQPVLHRPSSFFCLGVCLLDSVPVAALVDSLSLPLHSVLLPFLYLLLFSSSFASCARIYIHTHALLQWRKYKAATKLELTFKAWKKMHLLLMLLLAEKKNHFYYYFLQYTTLWVVVASGLKMWKQLIMKLYYCTSKIYAEKNINPIIKDIRICLAYTPWFMFEIAENCAKGCIKKCDLFDLRETRVR